MSTLNIVRQPDEFKYGDEFDLFFDRFAAYIVNVKVAKANQFDLFKSFLDASSFRRLQTLTFTDAHKTDTTVDLVKARGLLKDALQKPSAVPFAVQMRFRRQQRAEPIADFGYEMQVLGQKAYGDDGVNTPQVIEAFCSGLYDQELTAKLLLKLSSFNTLKAAIDYATQKESTLGIKSFIAKNRSSSSRNQDIDVLAADVENVSLNRPDTRSSSSQRGAHPTRYAGSSGISNRGARNNTNSAARETRRCYYCSLIGHISRDCYKRLRENGRGNTSSTRAHSRSTTYHPRARSGFHGRPGNQ